MCVYSLAAANRRPAVAGETLVLREFPHGSKGMVDPNQVDVAVCIRPYSLVRLVDLDQHTREHLGLTKAEVQAQLQVYSGGPDGDDPNRTDVFFLAEGPMVYLQDLPVGTHLVVLSI